jgi:phosphoglycolate phosphatase-like HAD superfamily hydrolase
MSEPISREALMKTIENLTVSNERLEQSKVKIAEQIFDSVGCFMDSEPMTVELALQCVRQKWAERDAWEDSATQRITALMAEIEQWKTWGIIEIAVRNPNVASYMEHWEGRATKAEALVESVHRELADRRKELDTAYDMIRELLKGGEHEGRCDDEDDPEFHGPCFKHIAASDAREAAARKLLEEIDGPQSKSTV